MSPEGLFRHTQAEWIDSHARNWNVWKEFAITLLQMFDTVSTTSPTSGSKQQKQHLEIVGAIEEGILTIERYIAHSTEAAQQQGDDRDAVLADLYVTYGNFLSQLSPIECWKLANDPHTLLIGAPETIQEYQQKQLDEKEVDEIQLIKTLFPPLCHDNADNAVRNAMSLDATNTDAIQLLEKLTGINDPTQVHKRKPKEFVAELFDSFATTFDDKLVNTLEYKVPQLIGNAVRSIVGKNSTITKTFSTVLDAGCGTGLAGRELRPMITNETGILIGVDASSKMLDIAANCTFQTGCGKKEKEDDESTKALNEDNNDPPLYDRLLQLDLEDMTIENTLDEHSASNTYFDLIVAADVFVYFGTLERILQVFSELSNGGDSDKRSSSSSWLVFSCERATPEEAPLGFRLLGSGRFAHTKDHVIEMATKASYTLFDYQEITPRMEKGEPVRGHLFVFEKRNGGGSDDEVVDDVKNEL